MVRPPILKSVYKLDISLKSDNLHLKTKVAVVVPEMLPVPPVKGGAIEHWVHQVVNKLDPQRFDITVISRPSGLDASESASPEQVRYVGIPWTRLEKACYWLKERVSWRNPLRYLAKIQNVMAYGLRITAQVKEAAIVIVHNEPNLLLLMRKQAHQLWILHMHNNHLNHSAFKWFYQRMLRQVDLVICVSAYIQNMAQQSYPQHAHKFVVLFNATDTELFQPYGQAAKTAVADLLQLPTATPLVLYVGRLTQEKGVDVLIQAFKQTLTKYPSVRLVIAGSSFFEGAAITSYQKYLADIARPIANHIVFTGFIPHAQLKHLYAAADIVALPSVWQDPCPLVVLETMASGTCIVASRVGGVPEVVEHEVNGLLVTPNQVEALAQALSSLLAEPQRATQMAQAARQKVVNGYAWEHLVHKLEHLLLNLPQPKTSI